MKNYNEPSVEVMALNVQDIVKTSADIQFTETPDITVGQADFKW